MSMDLWTSLSGVVAAELTSSEPEQLLALANAAEIEFFQMQQINDLTCRFRVRRRDYKKLHELVKKRGDNLKLLGRFGLYWSWKAILFRPVLLAGLGILFLLAMYLPSRVLFVRVEGNSQIPDRQILAAAEECGIRFGASRREVRSEKVKNALLSSVPQLQWAGVNTAGCVATISVRERAQDEPPQSENIVSNIVAARDGFILSCTVTNGNGIVKVGQTVQKGQVLVSGYTDCGICIRATRAEGEIYAQTIHQLTAITPSSCTQRQKLVGEKHSYSILIGKKRINLWNSSGISDTSCGRMYEEYHLSLPGGFSLPLAICVQTDLYYDTETVRVPDAQAEEALNSFAQSYLLDHMIAGKIQNHSQAVKEQDGLYRLDGVYVCEEMIGREQLEQNGETNGKTN